MDRDRGRDQTGTWGTDTMTFQDDELSYALGKQGGTRKKLERSSGAVVQYVGHNALFSGTREERRRAKSYMKWRRDRVPKTAPASPPALATPAQGGQPWEFFAPRQLVGGCYRLSPRGFRVAQRRAPLVQPRASVHAICVPPPRSSPVRAGAWLGALAFAAALGRSPFGGPHHILFRATPRLGWAFVARLPSPLALP